MLVFCLAQDFVLWNLRRRLLAQEHCFAWADDITLDLINLLRFIAVLETYDEIAVFCNLHFHPRKLVFVVAFMPSDEERAQWLAWATPRGWASLDIRYEGEQLGAPVGARLDLSRIYVKAEGKMLRALQQWKHAAGTAPNQRMRVLNVWVNTIPGYIGQFYPPDAQFLGRVKLKEVCYVFGMPMIKAWAMEALDDAGVRHAPHLLDSVLPAAMHRAHYFSGLGGFAADVKDPLAPICIADFWAAQEVVLRRKSGGLTLQGSFLPWRRSTRRMQRSGFRKRSVLSIAPRCSATDSTGWAEWIG